MVKASDLRPLAAGNGPVLKAIGKVRHWWRNGRADTAATTPFEVVCMCGHASRGLRQAQFQAVPCAGCGRRLFILPLNPLSAVVASGARAAANSVVRTPYRPINPWMWPLVAGGATFAVAVAIFILVLSHILPNSSTKQSLPAATPAEVDSLMVASRNALTDGDYPRAVEELGALQTIVARQPELVSLAETRRLTQLQRQAALFAAWPREPLEQILARTSKLNNDEWQAAVGRYRCKAVFFDAEVRRNATGRYHVESRRPFPGVDLRLDVQNLQLLHRLPLADPQRLLFGAQLAEVKRESAGVYRVHLQPDSGVLLTDIGLANACSPQSNDAALADVVKKQARWLAELP